MKSPSEVWRTIADFPEYAVSNPGRVRRIVPTVKATRGNGYLKATPQPNDYLAVSLYRDAKMYRRNIHVLVCPAFHGPRPSSKHEVAHNDGNRANPHETNLRWATRSENHADKKKHGTSQHGSRNGNSKLTERQVSEIRRSRLPLKAIGAKYGISKNHACIIRSGTLWAHVQ